MLKETPGVGIHRATPADASRLAEFAANAFRITYGPSADPACGGGSRAADVDAYVRDHFGERHQRAELADPSLITLVAVPQTSTSDTLAGEPLAAYAQLVRPAAPRATAELARLYVHPRWQGQGLAAALLGAVVDAARADAAEWLQLAVYQRNARAVAFYRRHGFSVSGAATFQMGSERQDDWIMVRALS